MVQSVKRKDYSHFDLCILQKSNNRSLRNVEALYKNSIPKF